MGLTVENRQQGLTFCGKKFKCSVPSQPVHDTMHILMTRSESDIDRIWIKLMRGNNWKPWSLNYLPNSTLSCFSLLLSCSTFPLSTHILRMRSLLFSLPYKSTSIRIHPPALCTQSTATCPCPAYPFPMYMLQVNVYPVSTKGHHSSSKHYVSAMCVWVQFHSLYPSTTKYGALTMYEHENYRMRSTKA